MIHFLEYDGSKWEEIVSEPLNTLQMFITNECNLRCKGCFYGGRLGKGRMTLNEYKNHIAGHLREIRKVIILGGEPTMHPDLVQMVEFNDYFGLKTTIYTNGYNLAPLAGANLSNVSIRLSVYGISSTEKSILKLSKSELSVPVMMVYMLTKDNVAELMPAAKIAERDLGCKKFFISSIRDIAASGNYWKDTEYTLLLDDYARVIQDFMKNYGGKMEIHISRRGTLTTEKSSRTVVDKCRFGNIFPNGDKIICPFDTCKNLTTDALRFNERKCGKHSECLLRKITLKRK